MSTPDTTPRFEIVTIGAGVEEVHENGHQVGLITFNPTPMCATFYATYAGGDNTIPYRSHTDALEALRLQHEAVKRFVRSIRSIRPAPLAVTGSYANQSVWDRGYNAALRDIERLSREVVGQAQPGEGYTAITQG